MAPPSRPPTRPSTAPLPMFINAGLLSKTSNENFESIHSTNNGTNNIANNGMNYSTSMLPPPSYVLPIQPQQRWSSSSTRTGEDEFVSEQQEQPQFQQQQQQQFNSPRISFQDALPFSPTLDQAFSALDGFDLGESSAFWRDNGIDWI